MWEQVGYIASDSPGNAMAWYDRLVAAVEAIGEHPGFAVDERASEQLKAEVRRMVFERTYLVFFIVNEQRGVVEVIGFRHGMRLPKRGEP